MTSNNEDYVVAEANDDCDAFNFTSFHNYFEDDFGDDEDSDYFICITIDAVVEHLIATIESSYMYPIPTRKTPPPFFFSFLLVALQ